MSRSAILLLRSGRWLSYEMTVDKLVKRTDEMEGSIKKMKAFFDPLEYRLA